MKLRLAPCLAVLLLLSISFFGLKQRAYAQQLGSSFSIYKSPQPIASSTTNIVVDATPAPVSHLEYYISKTPFPTLTPVTFIQYLVRVAIQRGINPQVIVFMLLFPVVASIVAFSRHVVGLSGFSIYTPAGLAVVFLSTGIAQGVVLFIALFIIASIGRQMLSVLKLEYIPRTAMLLWLVAIGMFLFMFTSTLLPLHFFMRVDVFPLLILVLLSEDFVGLQGELKWRESIERSAQIMMLAIIGALIIGNTVVQEFVIIHPEIIVLFVGLANFLIGKYLGLRLTEYLRFQPIIDAEE